MPRRIHGAVLTHPTETLKHPVSPRGFPVWKALALLTAQFNCYRCLREVATGAGLEASVPMSIVSSNVKASLPFYVPEKEGRRHFLLRLARVSKPTFLPAAQQLPDTCTGTIFPSFPPQKLAAVISSPIPPSQPPHSLFHALLLGPEDVFLDLGSGSGRLVLGTTLLFPHLKACYGVEVVPELHGMAVEARKRADTMEDRPGMSLCRFVQRNGETSEYVCGEEEKREEQMENPLSKAT